MSTPILQNCWFTRFQSPCHIGSNSLCTTCRREMIASLIFCGQLTLFDMRCSKWTARESSECACQIGLSYLSRNSPMLQDRCSYKFITELTALFSILTVIRSEVYLLSSRL
jgi:hypothetical protein